MAVLHGEASAATICKLCAYWNLDQDLFQIGARRWGDCSETGVRSCHHATCFQRIWWQQLYWAVNQVGRHGVLQVYGEGERRSSHL